MTYPEAIRFLYNLRLFGLKLGLENTFKLAALAGNPHERLRFIHVAGTNGKGSTCAMLESIYRTAGLRVGLFTSPHLVSFRERIQVDRQFISEADVVRLVAELRAFVAAGILPAVEPGVAPGGTTIERSSLLEKLRVGPSGKMPPSTSGGTPDATAGLDAHPTFFEVLTVMALRYFAERNCDLVIWETGMGGRLDATNIVTPLASVITNIGFDHQQWLGDTLAKIAYEKTGIIKPGVPVITATEIPEALAVIEEITKNLKAPLTKVGQASSLSTAGETPALPLAGEHQRLNAALAAATVRVIRDRISVSDDNIRRGLETVQWPGRMQLVKAGHGQSILLDGAHNTAGAEAFRTAFLELFPATRPTLILGVLDDKEWSRMCEVLAPLASRILVSPVSSDRTAPSEPLRVACGKINPNAETIACSSLADALTQAANDPFVVITGSLYLVGDALERLGVLPAATRDERDLNDWQPPR